MCVHSRMYILGLLLCLRVFLCFFFLYVFFLFFCCFFFFQAEDGIRDLVRSRGLGDVYKRQHSNVSDKIIITTMVDWMSMVIHWFILLLHP